MKPIITVGSAMRDIFIECKSHSIISESRSCQPCIAIEEGRKIPIDTLTYAVGGGALNTAVSFTRLGFNAYPIVKLGTDAESSFLLKELQKENVHTDYIYQDETLSTGISFIIPSPSGNRAVLVYRGASTHLNSEEIPYESIKNASALYVASLNDQAANLLPQLAKFAHESKITLIVNPGTSQLTTQSASLLKVLSYISILILNAHEAHLLMRHMTEKKMSSLHTQALPNDHILFREPLEKGSAHHLVDFFSLILAKGPNIVIVTNGKDGVYATDGNTIFFHPSIATTVVSTIGAGDAFGSAFCAHFLKNHSLANALQAGSLNSAAALESVGATTSLLTAAKLEKKLAENRPPLLKSYMFRL